MAERSLLTEVVQDLLAERQALLDARTAKPVPFMMEKVPRKRFIDDMRAMTPAQRKTVVQRVGIAGLRKQLKQGLPAERTML